MLKAGDHNERPHGARVPERGGRYVRQAGHYRAFIPNPLPPQPPVRIDGTLQRRLSDADLALGRLDGSIQTLPNPDLFVLMYVRKEAVLSSQIEGTQSSLQDLLAAEARIFGLRRSQDVDEVINYVSAMNHGIRRLAEIPVSVRLIREIHDKLLQGVRGSQLTPGELRRSQNWIGPAGCSLNEATFVPPPPHLLADSFSDLEKFLHTVDDLPILVKIGLAHAQFETIHPFLDGNGRVGRLLITLLLCEKRILQNPVLYLSYFFKKNRQRYYDLLQETRDSGDFEGWLAFFLQGVAEVSRQAAETARRILSLREEHRNRIAEGLGRAAGNGHRLLEHLFERPIVSVTDVERLLGITYPAANALIGRMVSLDLLQEMTGRVRNRRFRYEPYVRLFGED